MIHEPNVLLLFLRLAVQPIADLADAPIVALDRLRDQLLRYQLQLAPFSGFIDGERGLANGALNRPGGNLTGYNAFIGELGAKGLALLHELVPGAAKIGFPENPSHPAFELTTRDVLTVASVMGVSVQILEARTDREIDAAFASLDQTPTRALLVGSDVFLMSVAGQS